MKSTSDDWRFRKYEAKFDGEQQSELALKNKAQVLGIQRDIFAQQVAVESKTKLILAVTGKSIMLNPFYLAFAKEIQRAFWQGLRSAQLIDECDIILNKWVGYGLDRDTLEKIRNSVFTLAAPTP